MSEGLRDSSRALWILVYIGTRIRLLHFSVSAGVGHCYVICSADDLYGTSCRVSSVGHPGYTLCYSDEYRMDLAYCGYTGLSLRRLSL